MVKTLHCPECLRTSEVSTDFDEDDIYIEPKYCPFCGYKIEEDDFVISKHSLAPNLKKKELNV